jgi:tetratricopeptide (TPR) repeat protein
MATLRAGLVLLVALGAHAQTGGYSGSQSCRTCHAAFFELWSTSHHGLAMQPFTPDFAHRELTFENPRVNTAQAVYTAALDARGGSIVEEKTGAKRAYAIQQVLGGKYIYYFLTTLERGHMQVLPLAFDVRKRAWVETTASIVTHSAGDRDQPVDWRDRMLTFNTSCYGCHVSQLATHYTAGSDTYRTTWGEPGINCETCHGPSADHVRKFRERTPGEDIHIVSMKRLTIQQRNEACASCHAKLTPLDGGFRPGDRFFDHYNLAALENDDFYPDGRDRRENYTYTGWLMSACARSGKLDCLHCHTSSGKQKFPAAQANNACLPCHEERVKNAKAHSHHAAGSAGSRCVSCHMPTTEYAKMRRSDHSMRPPAPESTLAYGSPNACNLCHKDRGAGWARDRMKEWFGEGRQQRLLAQAGFISAARKRDWSKLPSMLAFIGRRDRDEVFAASLIRLLEPCRDPAKVPALLKALEDPSPLIRSSALNALSGDWSADTLSALSRAARDEYKVVRIQAGAVLAALVPEGVPGRDRRKLDEPSRRAAEEYVASLKSRPDDYAQHMSLGVLYADRGQSQAALDEYATAIRLRPGWAPPLVNASLVYSALGNDAKAEESLRMAIGIDPGNAAAHFNLGLLLAETGRRADAEASLRRSLALDPKNAPAAFNLAVLVSGTRRAEAIRWCRRAVEADPGEGRYVYTLAFYLAQGGETQAAIRELEAAAARHSPTPEERDLLNSLRSR